jgi:dGTPase
MDKLTAKYGGFEGNAQSFRILTKVAFRSADYRELDLTRATLAAVLKYPWFRGAISGKLDKIGAYETERRDFEFARELYPNSQSKTMEAALMDWGDDITYSIHDLEDFYRAGECLCTCSAIEIPVSANISLPISSNDGMRGRRADPKASWP